MSGPLLDRSAAQLKRSFDEAFSRPRPEPGGAREQLLSVRIGSRLLALRVKDTAGVVRAPGITAVPSDNPSLVGLAGIRGALVAVYDLWALVGDGPRAAQAGWLALCAADRSAALLFDELVGYHLVDVDEIHAAPDSDGRAAVEQTVRIGDVHRAVVDVSRLLTAVGRSADAYKGRESSA